MRVGPKRLMPTVPGRMGARARKYSSSKMTCCMKLAPRPPYSLGQDRPTQPAACIFFCQVRRFSSVSRSGETRWSCASSTFSSSGRLASSQSRNSARNAASADASAKSMAVLPLGPRVPSRAARLNAAQQPSLKQLPDVFVHDLDEQRIGAWPQMQYVDKMLAEIVQVLGVEQRKQVDQPDPELGADLAGNGIAFDDVFVAEPGIFEPVLHVAEKPKAGLVVLALNIGRQVAADDPGIERRWHRRDHDIRPPGEKRGEIGAQVSVPLRGAAVAPWRVAPEAEPAGRRGFFCRQHKGVPAEHQEVQRHRMAAVQRIRPSQDVGVEVAIEPAVQELVARSEPVEQARPAASGAEHNRIAPDNGELALRVEGVPLQPHLVALENYRPGLIDKDKVRAHARCFAVPVKRLEGVAAGNQVHVPQTGGTSLRTGRGNSFLVDRHSFRSSHRYSSSPRSRGRPAAFRPAGP